MTVKQDIKRKAVLTLAYHDYAKGLNSHAFFKTNDHTTGEDLVQDTFTKTFLYHVLNNLIVDQYRKNKTSSLDVLMEKGFEPGDDHPKHLFDVLDGKAALLLIQRLPVAYRNVMRMRYVQGLSLQEMSLITGHSKNALSVQTHRGLAKLKLLYSLPVVLPLS